MSSRPEKKERLWRWAKRGLLFLVAWSLVAWGAAHALIVRAELSRADAIVVLSGSATYVERTRRAAQLLGEGRAPVVVLTNDNEASGWSSAEQRNPLFVERAVGELRRAGVSADQILVLPGEISSTYDEALLLRQYALTNNVRSLLVVTSAYHSRRALWTLRHVFAGSGVEVGLDVTPPGQQTPLPATWWWHPRGWSTVAFEYPKLIYYWLNYR